MRHRMICAPSRASVSSQTESCSAFPPLAPDIEAAGGTFVDGPDVVDGNLVSCRGWGDLAEWSRAFVATLERAAVPA